MSTFLEAEILSQPEAITRLLEREMGHIEQIVAELPKCSYALIAARGTSDHAGSYASYAWSALAGLPVSHATPSLYTLYNTPPRMDNALVVGISQSGQSPDIVAVLEEARKQNRPTIAITNNPNSPLAAIADHVVELHAGPEQSVAATKTYTSQLTAMAMFAATWSKDDDRVRELFLLPEAIDATLKANANMAQRTERYRYMNQCVIIGRGYNYATAFELTLKLKELTYVMADAYSSAGFRHGPIATISEGIPAILVMPKGPALADMVDLAQDLRSRGAELITITDDLGGADYSTVLMPIVGGLPEWLSPIASIVPGQLFALELAQLKGLDPDHPRGLNKVTLTH
jgi:glucosamine--fructose-6-phosphate aminotransferase (isomerizing)